MDTTLGELAASIGGELTDATLAGSAVKGIRSLSTAGPDEVSFFKGDPRYLDDVRATRALAVVADTRIEGVERPLILVEDAGVAVSFLLAVVRDLQNPPPAAGVHPRATVDPSVTLGDAVSVGPGAVIEAGVRIGARSRVLANAFIGRGTVVGEDCIIHPGANVLHNCTLGSRVIIWSGAVVGRDGFGFIQRDGRHLRVPQIGGVVLGDDVEVGAYSTVDRGALDPTVLGDGVKLDAHCHVAHNCTLGANTMLIGAAHLAGGVVLGKNVILGPEAAVNERGTIGDGGVLAAGAKLQVGHVPAGGVYWGDPARPITLEKRIQVVIGKLPEVVKEIRELRKKVAALETGIVTRLDSRGVDS
jgi:UDP-3-O-[3-hydroxymyristoyl] glucosamine N-acyltransferase